MKAYKVNNLINSPSLKDVKIGGYTEELMNAFFKERIFSDHAKNVVYKEAESAFSNPVDDETAVGYWRGEFWGKWIISACEVFKYTQDTSLKEFIKQAAYNVMSFQRDDGYIGSYKDSKNFMPADPKETLKTVGFECVWNWNIWCRKYTLWGLLECYELTQDEAILRSAQRHADLVIKEINEAGVELRQTGTFFGLPSCSIMKPMLILHKYTEDDNYLNFAVEIAENWERSDNQIPNLIANSLSGKRLTDWYPNSPKWAKAYEMMSCFEGIIELYRYTGTEKYLKSAECFYEILKEYEQNLIFSVAYNDLFADAADEINAISEPCDIIHWMRVCSELYKLTGNSKYMDTFENAFFNPFLASVFRDGKWGARCVRGAGRHFSAPSQCTFKYNHCCVNNMPRGFMNMAECAIMQKSDAVVINLYESNTVTLDGASVKISEGYFKTGEVDINVEFSSSPSKIMLRIPSWSKDTQIMCSGTSCNFSEGFAVITDTQKSNSIHVKFDIKPVIHEFKKPIPTHTADDWKLRRWLLPEHDTYTLEDEFLHEKRCIITYGATLLAKSKFAGDTEDEIFRNPVHINENYNCKITPLDADNTRLKFLAEISDGTHTIKTNICDYATSGNIKSDDPYLFSIYF